MADTILINKAYDLLNLVNPNSEDVAIKVQLGTELDFAFETLSQGYFGKQFEQAQIYYALHWFLIKFSSDYESIATNANNNVNMYAIGSASSEGVSVSYQVPSASANGDSRFGDTSQYQTTRFGRSFLAIQSQCYGGISR